jgi:hypothetical protein
MKKGYLTDCNNVMDLIYEYEKDNFMPVLTQIRVGFHLLFCSDCAREYKNLRALEEVMRTDFLPPAPDFGELIMERIAEEENEQAYMEEKNYSSAGFSLRSWVIIGFFLLLSLSSSFFGMHFVEIANSEGLSFLLPVGITIGIIVTCYGALFIGSHLKELSSRFGLR